jgi:hypothetical protein
MRVEKTKFFFFLKHGTTIKTNIANYLVDGLVVKVWD